MRRHVFGSIVTLTLAGGAFGCTSSQTSTALTPSASAKCQVQVGSATTAFTADGGKGTLAVATTRDCTWSVSTNADWVSLASTNGQGNGAVPYIVAANPVPASRAAEIAVSDATLQLNQAAAPCHYSLGQSGASIGSPGGTLTVELTTLGGCTWTAASDVPWLTVTSGASGNGSGTIRMSVAANTGAARAGRMQAGGQIYGVSQSSRSSR